VSFTLPELLVSSRTLIGRLLADVCRGGRKLFKSFP
jgi:hypothetical protein